MEWLLADHRGAMAHPRRPMTRRQAIDRAVAYLTSRPVPRAGSIAYSSRWVGDLGELSGPLAMEILRLAAIGRRVEDEARKRRT